MADSSLNFTTRVDLSGLKSGMEDATATVQTGADKMAAALTAAKAATQQLAEAQKQLGPSAVAGNQQAVAILQEYQEKARAAAAAVDALAAAQNTDTAAAAENAVANTAAAAATERVGVSARQGAAAGIGILEGRMMSGNRAAAAFLSTTLGLGPVIEAAFPIIGAVALGEVLVDVAGKITGLYDEFVNLRSIQDATFKEMIADEATEIQLSNQQLRLLRERSVLMAEVSGGKTGRSARGEEAGANFDLAQAKNDLAIVNEQIQVYQDRVSDLQSRANAKPAFSLFSKDSESSDQKVASIELPEAVQKLNNLLAEQKNIQTDISNAQLQGDLRHSQMAEAAAQAAKTAEAQRLSAERESESLVDREAKKEQTNYDKLNGIIERAKENARGIQTDEKDTGATAIDTYVEEQVKLNDAQIQGTEIQRDNANAIAEATIRAQAATGATTALATAHALATQHSKEYKEELDQLNADLAVYEAAGKDAEAAQTRNQISQVQGRQQVSGIQDQATVVSQTTQPWIQGANQIANAWTGAFDSILRGGQQSWGAVARAGEQTVLGLINGAERLTLNWIEGQVKRVVSHQVGNQTIVTSDAAAAAETRAISATTAITQIGHEAAVVFAKVYSALADIPIAGPVIAPVAAAGAYAGVIAMAAFDQGTYAVPRTGMAIIHKDEMILPPPQASVVRDALSGGGVNSGSTRTGLSLHYNPVFQSGGTPSDSRMAMRELHSQLRRQGLVQ